MSFDIIDPPFISVAPTETEWLDTFSMIDEALLLHDMEASTVEDYSMKISPASPLTIEANGGTQVQFKFCISNMGYADSYTLTVPILPSGFSAQFSPCSPISVASGTSASVTAIFGVSSGINLGTYMLDIRARSRTDSNIYDEILFVIKVVDQVRDDAQNRFYTVVSVDHAGNRGINTNLVAGKVSAGQFAIDLKDNIEWNYISTPLVPMDTSPGKVLHTALATSIPPTTLGHIDDFPYSKDSYWSVTQPDYYEATISSSTSLIESKLRMGPIDLSNLGNDVSAITFILSHSYNIEYFKNGAIVEGSTDGVNFFKLASCFGYDTIIQEGTSSMVGSTVYQGNHGKQDRFDLTIFKGSSTFYLRFTLCSDKYTGTSDWKLFKATSMILVYYSDLRSPIAFTFDNAIKEHLRWPTLVPLEAPPPRPWPYVGQCTQLMTAIDHTMGINVQTLGDQTLIVTGTIPTSTTIPIYEGWNCVGYPSFIKRTVAEALGGVPNYGVFTYDENGMVVEMGQDDIMRPGKGYFIAASTDANWVVSCLGASDILPHPIIDMSQSVCNEGDGVDIFATITNPTTSSIFNLTVNFYIASEPVLIDSVLIPVVPPLSNITVDTYWVANVGTGNHSFRVTVDYNGRIVDGYISDSYKKISITPKPVPQIDVYQDVNLTLEIAGRKDNSVTLQVYEDSLLVNETSVTRQLGDLKVQGKTITMRRYLDYFDKNYTIKLIYDATHQGANPTTLTFNSGDNTLEYSITFNANDGYHQEIIIDASYLKNVVQNNTLYYFDASNSFGTGITGENVSYSWDFGDRCADDGILVNHRYRAVDEYTVVLAVYDEEDNFVASASVIICGDRLLIPFPIPPLPPPHLP